MENKVKKGHIAAFTTIGIWGTTFISTKVLLQGLSPVEILFYRFLIGFLILIILRPRNWKSNNKKDELLFIGAGITGITLYYLLENIALTYTMASNVGVIISIAPFFTALLANIFFKNEKFDLFFFIGFILAMCGIFLISFQSLSDVQLNPFGDFLAVVAAFLWALYSILSRKIASLGYHTIDATKKTFLYGIIFMIPALFFMDFQIDMHVFTDPMILLNILFLGICASAVCFVTWNYAVRILGAIKTSVYIYMVPVITIVTSFIFLKEPINEITLLGASLTLCGLYLSQKKRT